MACSSDKTNRKQVYNVLTKEGHRRYSIQLEPAKCVLLMFISTFLDQSLEALRDRVVNKLFMKCSD